jgi:hypothetical protein
MSESLKVLKARFVDTSIDLRKSLLSTTGHQHVELDLLDELITIHNEMIREVIGVVDNIEEQQIQSLQTIQYISNITNRLKEE